MIDKKYIIVVLAIVITLAAVGVYVRQKKWQEFYRNYPKGNIRIEVQNGTGIEGFAFKMTKIFRYHGFDVVDFRNADSKKYKKTVIIDMRGNNPELKILQQFIKTNVVYKLYNDKAEREGTDAIVILGEDVLENEVFKESRYSGRILFDEKSTRDNSSIGR